MDLHRLRVVGFETLPNVEKGKNKNIAEHEENKKEDDVMDENKQYETNKLDEANDKKCAEDNAVYSGSSKSSNFMNRKSKSEIFRIPSRNKLQNRDLKINSSLEDLPKQLKQAHLNKKKKTLKLFNRRSTVDLKQRDLRKKLDASKNHEDIHFLFTRETPSFIRYSRKRAKHDRPKIGYDQKYSNDLCGFKKNNRYFDPYLYQMSCNYLNIDKFPLKKLRKGFRRKLKTKSQPSKDCTCKHHAMRVLNSAVKSSDRGDSPSIYYNLNTVHSHVRRHRRKRDVTFRQNEGWARDPYHAMHKDQNVAVSPSSLAPLKRCCCDACVGSSKVEITSRPHRRPPVAYRDATSSHHKPPGKYRPKPSSKQSPESQHKPSSQDSSLSHHKLISEHTPGSSSPKDAPHLYKPQFVVCKSRKNRKKKRKSSFLNNQRKKIFRGLFQNIAAFHTKSRISGKNCIKYVFFGLLIVVWSPCLLAVILAWVVMCPVRLTNMLADDKSRKTFAFWKSFTERFRKKDPGSDYKQMCCDHCRQNRKSFLTSVASWYARAAGTVMTSFNALISMLKSKKARSCGSSFMTSPHPNPRQRYTLYYADNRGWMMKPTRRTNYNRSSNRVVQSMRCEFRPKFWPKSKTDPNPQVGMEAACTNTAVQCPVHGDKCAKVKALRRKMLSPAGDAGQMPMESTPSCVCEAYLKWSKNKQRSAMMPETSSRYDPGQKVNIPSMKFNPSYGKASTSQNYQPMNTNPLQFNLSKKNEIVKKSYPKCQSQWKSGTLPLGLMFDCPCGTKHPIIANREVCRTHMFGLAGKTLNFSAKYSLSSKDLREAPIKSRIALNCPCGEDKKEKKKVANRKIKELTKAKQINIKDIHSKQKRSQSQTSTKRIALNCPCDGEPTTSGKKLQGTRATDRENKTHKHTSSNKHKHQIRTRNRGVSAELSQSALTRQAKTSTIEINKTDKTQSISKHTLRQRLKYLVDKTQSTSLHSFRQKTELVDRSQNVSKYSFSHQKFDLIDKSQNVSKTSINQHNIHLIDRSQNVSKHSFGQNKRELIDRSQNISQGALNVDQVNSLVECGCWTETESPSDKKRTTHTSLIDRLLSKSNISQKLSIDKASPRISEKRDCACGSSTQQTFSHHRPTQKMQPSGTVATKPTLAQVSKEQTEKAAITKTDQQSLILKNGIDCKCNITSNEAYKKESNKNVTSSETASCGRPFCYCPFSTHHRSAINKETITKEHASASEKHEKADKSFFKSSTTQREKLPLKQSVPYKLAIDCGCGTDKQLLTASDLQPRVTNLKHVQKHEATDSNKQIIPEKQQGTTSEKKKRPVFYGKCLCSKSVSSARPSTTQKKTVPAAVSSKGTVTCECWPEKKQSTMHKETILAKEVELSKEKVECGCETTSVTFKDTVPEEQAKPSKLMVECGCETEDQPNASLEKIPHTILKGSKSSLTRLSHSTLSETPSKIDIALNCPCGSSHQLRSNYTNSTTISKKTSMPSPHLSQRTVSVKQDPRYIIINCPCPASPQPSTIDRETITSNETIFAKKQTMALQRSSTDKASEAPSKVAPISSKQSLSAKTVDCACGPDPIVGDKKPLDGLSVIHKPSGPYPSVGDKKTLVGLSGIPKQQNEHSKSISKNQYVMASACKTNNTNTGSLHTQQSVFKSKTVNEVIDVRLSQIVNNTESEAFPYGVASNCSCANKKLTQYKTDSRKKMQSESRKQEISSQKLLSIKNSSPKNKSLADKDKRPTEVEPLAELKHPSSIQVIPKTPQKQSISDENEKNAVDRKKTFESSLTQHPSSIVTKDSQSQILQKQSSLYGKALDCPCDSVEDLLSKPPRTKSVGVAPETISKKNESTKISSSRLLPSKHLQSTQTPRLTLQKQAPEVEMATDCECAIDAEDEKLKNASKSDKKRSSGGQKSSAVTAQPLKKPIKSKSSDVGITTHCECSSEIAIQERRPQSHQSIKSDIKSLRGLSTGSAEHRTTPHQPLETQSPVFGVSPDCPCSNKLKINKSSMKPFHFDSHKASQTRPTQMTKKRSDLQRHIATKSSLTEEPKQTTLLKYPRKTSLTKISSNQQKKISHVPRDTSQMFNKLKQSFNKSKKQTLAQRDSDKLSDTLKKNSQLSPKPSLNKEPRQNVKKKVQVTQTKPIWFGRPCLCPPESRSASYKKRKIDYIGKSKKQLSKKGSEKSNSYQSRKSKSETTKVSSVESSHPRALEERLDSLRQRISSFQRLPPCSCEDTTNRSSTKISRPLCCCSINDKRKKKKFFYPVVTSRHHVSQTSLNHTKCDCSASDRKVPVVTKSHLFKSVVVQKSQIEKGQPQIPKQKLSIPHSSQKMLPCPDQVIHDFPKRNKKKIKCDKIKQTTQKTFETKHQSSKKPCFHSECACSSVKQPLTVPLPPSTITYASSRLSRLVMKLHCKMFSRKKCPQTKITQPATKCLGPSTQCSVSRQSKISHLSTNPVSVQQTSSLHTRKSTLGCKSQVSFKRNNKILRKSSRPTFSLNSNSRFRCPVHKDFSKYPSGNTTRHICEPNKLDKPCTCSIKDSISQQSRQSIVSYVSCRKCFSHGVPSLQLSSIKTSNQTPKSLVAQYYPRLSQRSVNQRSKTSHYTSKAFPVTPIKCNCSTDKISRTQKGDISGHILKTSSAKKSHLKLSKRVPNKQDKISQFPSHSHQTKSSAHSDAIRDLPENLQKLSISRHLKSQQTIKPRNVSTTDKSQRLRTTSAEKQQSLDYAHLSNRENQTSKDSSLSQHIKSKALPTTSAEKQQSLESVSHAHQSNRANQTSKDSSLSQHIKSKAFSEKLKHFSNKLSRHSHKHEKKVNSPLLIPGGCYCDQISEKISQLSHETLKNVKSPPLRPEEVTEKVSQLSHKNDKSPPLIPGECYCDEITDKISQLLHKIDKPLPLIPGKCYCDNVSEKISQLSHKSGKNDKSLPLIPGDCYCDEISEKISQLSHKNGKHVKSPPLIPGPCYCDQISENISKLSHKSSFENKLRLKPSNESQYIPSRQGSHYPCHVCLDKEGQTGVFHHLASQQTNVPEPADSKLNVATSFSFHQSQHKQLTEKVNNLKVTEQPYEHYKQENIDPQKRVLHYSNNQPAQRYPLHPFIPIPILPGKCTCSEKQGIKSMNTQNLKEEFLNQQINAKLTPSVHKLPESQSAEKLRLLSEKLLPHHKATMKTEEPPTPSEKNQPSELIRHFPQNSTLNSTEQPEYSEHLSIRKSKISLTENPKSTLSRQSTLQNQPVSKELSKSEQKSKMSLNSRQLQSSQPKRSEQQELVPVSYLPRKTSVENENQHRDTQVNLTDQQPEISEPSLSGQPKSQNQLVLKEPSKSKHQLLELEPNPAIPIIPGVCKCSRNQSEYSKLQQNPQNLLSHQTKNSAKTTSMHSIHPRLTENKQRLSDHKTVGSEVPYKSLNQQTKISSNKPHVSSTPIQSANKQRLSSVPVSPLHQKSSKVDDEEQRRNSQSHASAQTKIPQKSLPIQQIQPRRIIPGMCTCSISKHRISPAIVQNQLQKTASESKSQPQILNQHLSQPHRIRHQPSHIYRIEQPQSFAKKKRNSSKIGQTEKIHGSRCQQITIQRSEVSHNRPGSLRFVCPNEYDDPCTGNVKCEGISSPNKMSHHILSTTTPVDKPPGLLLQQRSTGQVHPVRKRSTDSGKQQKITQPANAQQFPVGPQNMPPPQPDFNRVAMRYPGHNPNPEHIPSPANYYYPPPAAGVPPPNYARLPCFINPLNNCGPKSSGDEQSLRRAYKRRPIRFIPPKQQEKIPKSKPNKPLKKVAEVKKKKKKKQGGKFSRMFDCFRELVTEAEKEAWPIAVACRPLYIHAMRRRPCFWVYECCPSLYPMFLSCYKFQENICQMFMYILSICFWCPLILCVYFCCDLMCGSSN